ncbi:MAG TPA: hypothetical protein VMA72_29060 [Streptosporangiaceae bacterium]|nr:hypothetical protein [Streptosporangiaceae bacterium]
MADVLTLVGLKVTLLRRSMTGSRGGWSVAEAMVGTCLALSTVALSALSQASRADLADLLGVIYALWLAGWVVGPVWGGAPLVRAEHFALIPLPRRRLALGLLGTALAGLTAAVTLLAFISLVVFGARLGVLPALVAVPVVVLQLLLVVVLSRLAVTGYGHVARSRTGAGVLGVLLAGVLILSRPGWMLALSIRTSGLLSTGLTPTLATLVRALPSGWGLYAVEAAGRSDWLAAAGALASLVAAVALLTLAWSWKLGSPRVARAIIRGGRHVRISRTGPLAGPVGAVAVKELRTWWRDPLRVQAIAVALPWALGTCLLPLTFGSKALLPWAGPAMALTAAVSAVNLYGLDGTALWLTLVIPDAERNDVRGRQRAFLLLFGPVVTGAAIALTALAGAAWTWPRVLALTPALIGGGIGMLAWVSVVALVPGRDPHRRSDNPTENAGATGPGYVMFWAVLLPCLPAAGALVAGTVLHNALLRWASVPAGVATGVVLYARLGHLGYRRLMARGPEMLLKMRFGGSGESRSGDPSADRATGQPGLAAGQVAGRKAAITGIGIPLAGILLFPHGIVPAILKLAHARARVWFLPLYLPRPLQWPACFAMITLGVGVAWLVLSTVRQVRKSGA